MHNWRAGKLWQTANTPLMRLGHKNDARLRDREKSGDDKGGSFHGQPRNPCIVASLLSSLLSPTLPLWFLCPLVCCRQIPLWFLCFGLSIFLAKGQPESDTSRENMIMKELSLPIFYLGGNFHGQPRSSVDFDEQEMFDLKGISVRSYGN